MYSTCLFCNGDLGSNEVIEHFPVGRRLAFDGAKGRLWVVCRKCERWNLTPLEDRWEAIEECERLFSETRLRVSTDNIGLARVREGLELVRIGGALRPEMAAWRYGDQFGKRRRKHIALSVTGGAILAGVVIIGPATGIIAGGGWGMWQVGANLYRAYEHRRVRTRITLPESGVVIPIRKKQLDKIAVVRANDDWALRVPLPKVGGEARVGVFSGPDAMRAAAKLLPAMNERGAKKDEVQSAVKLITEAEDPHRLFQRYSGRPRPGVDERGERDTGEEGGGHVLTKLPKEVRLALEMASHEEQERRALEGELALLEAAWRDAEEIAKIADDMFLPASTDADLEALRAKG
jgi:hypothetical protein